MKEFKIATSMDTANIEEIQEFLDESIKGQLSLIVQSGHLPYYYSQFLHLNNSFHLLVRC